MDGRTRDIILEQGYLYRGTNDFIFRQRKEKGFYYGRKNSDYVTSTNIVLGYAMVAGFNRCKDSWLSQNNAKPILLAIDIQKYLDQMETGLEFAGPRALNSEIEISGKIDFDDVVVVDSLDRLLEVCPHAKQGEIDFFKREYLFEPTLNNILPKIETNSC